MKEKAPFRLVEMGAGSGQLAHDLQLCVKRNELGIEPSIWRRFVGAFEYVIVERRGPRERIPSCLKTVLIRFNITKGSSELPEFLQL